MTEFEFSHHRVLAGANVLLGLADHAIFLFSPIFADSGVGGRNIAVWVFVDGFNNMITPTMALLTTAFGGLS